MQQFRRAATSSWVLLVLGLALGYLTGISSSPNSTGARADVTEEPRREAFKPGDVVNQPVLREMAATLKRIEDQIVRIEKKIPSSAPARK